MTKVNVKKSDWEDFAKSVMPAGEIDIKVLDDVPLPAAWVVLGSPINGAFLTGLTARRGMEETDLARLWYGVVTTPPGVPANAQGLGNVPQTPGDTYTRSAVGLGNFVSGAGTGIHELGHALGRLHVLCKGESGTDAAYPYPMCQIGPWGYVRKDIFAKPMMVDPTKTADIMSYGMSTQPGWFFPFISDYTYMAFWARLRSYYGQQPFLVPGTDSRITYDAVAYDGPTVVKWVGQTKATLAQAPTGTVTLLAADGSRLGTVEAYFIPASIAPRGQWLIPASGAAQVLLPDSDVPVLLSASKG
jgi:hypothetical protein